jgi:transposase-like protein
MLHRIRLALRAKTFQKISGTIESDESFFGGAAKFMHKERREKMIKGRGAVGKTIAHGILERGGDVVVDVVPDQRKKTLQDRVRKHVAPGSFLFTDSLRSYEGLDGEFVHRMVDHAREYVRGLVHTNGIENFWSLVKRCTKGTYVRPSPWHLFRYLDEEAWRFNKRRVNDGERFKIAMQGIVGNRLTYAELTGKEDDKEGK